LDDSARQDRLSPSWPAMDLTFISPLRVLSK
jgi:hypothetical protein